jgi:hypothetical protein
MGLVTASQRLTVKILYTRDIKIALGSVTSGLW